MKQLISDINACYKNIDENTVSAILEIKRYGSDEYDMIFKYTFSLKTSEKNSIEVYKDIEIPEIYSLYMLLQSNPNYKGIFNIYFRVYQNEINDLRKYAIEKMNQLNNFVHEKKESIFNQMKNTTKKFFQELMEEGSNNSLNGTIIKVAAYKKEFPMEKVGQYANRCVIDILRYGTDSWENVYSYEYGKYKTGGQLNSVDSVSIYKKLEENDIFKIISFLQTEEEYEVIKKYLKTIPKEPHGDIALKKDEDKPKIENIKFL